MRKVEISQYGRDENKKRTVISTGFGHFHGWGSDYEELSAIIFRRFYD